MDLKLNCILYDCWCIFASLFITLHFSIQSPQLLLPSVFRPFLSRVFVLVPRPTLLRFLLRDPLPRGILHYREIANSICMRERDFARCALKVRQPCQLPS